MRATANSKRNSEVRAKASDIDEKCRRLITRHKRLKRLQNMKTPDIVVRNETRLLKAAVDDLLKDARVEEIVSRIGIKAFTETFNRIAGTEIDPPVVRSVGIPLAA